ncbi:hypothetical protein [Corallococcus sp. Z5C101001]|uniref:hypothetical protein n=1 Tax=Corallococcus sp. Z5C101001 TaxID=2596829 RepID=UPI00117D3007|nr:hypothetical protein [Corallococcus sp. Z5C101001]TSC23934.1 hypothetical protein FOF48_27400 [Corallococcus sp. Z5C101001]
MTPRALCLLIALAAFATAVGTAAWLAWPGPDLTSQADLSVAPGAARLGPREGSGARAVMLANGIRLPNVPSNCHADPQGSLACEDRCDADAACPAGDVCARHPDFGFRECQPRRRFCEDAEDCPPSESCHPVDPSASGQVLRRCTPEGRLRAGERCAGDAQAPEGRCAPGLQCVQGACGPPCDVHDPGACASGTECAPNPYRVRGACVPTCRDRPCPEGERCATDAPGEVPLCRPFVGPACADGAPCAAHQDCLRGFAEPSLETEAFECRARCDARTPCARGLSCDEASGYCFKPCTRDTDCPTPERCHMLHRRESQRGCGVIAEGLPALHR